MDSHEKHCDANEFYHPNASDNCEKQRICRRNTGKTVTSDMMPENTLMLAKIYIYMSRLYFESLNETI